MSSEGQQKVLGLFDQLMSMDITPIEQLSGDPQQTITSARSKLQVMLPGMPYIDEPDHVMADNLFFCAIMLSVFLALKEQGADVHDYGSLMLAVIERQAPAQSANEQVSDALVAAAAASNQAGRQGEFVFDVIESGDGYDWGMTIKSCAICSLYSAHDAMALVPYMCASDDVISDKSDQGLQRTGTIALGASHCDFQYKKGRVGDALVNHYPDRIRTHLL